MSQGPNRAQQNIDDSMGYVWDAYGRRVLSLEQTLDEYCYQFLSKDPKELNLRDRDQVISRHLAPKTSDQDHEITGKRPQGDRDTQLHICEDLQDPDETPILVVSNLVVWRLGGLLMSPSSHIIIITTW